MSLLDRIRICHRRDMAKYRPFLADGAAIGWINRDLAERLRGFPRIFHVAENGVELIPAGYEARTAAMADVVATLQ